jgi:peptide/nickel transport system substrate-binding protein
MNDRTPSPRDNRGFLLGMTIATAALAKKPGGILRVQHRDSPASISILEEGSVSAIMPLMGVSSNLILFDQHVPQNRVESIVPDLATSWSWSEDGTELTSKLREGVKWHDGKPFTAADVKCTYDLLTGRQRKNCGSITARRGSSVSTRSRQTATAKRAFI